MLKKKEVKKVEKVSIQTTSPDPTGDTKSRIEDKVRALPANQGLNEVDMWAKIDAEVEAAKAAGTFADLEERRDEHGSA